MICQDGYLKLYQTEFVTTISGFNEPPGITSLLYFETSSSSASSSGRPAGNLSNQNSRANNWGLVLRALPSRVFVSFPV
jgi:hypothetical protein